MILIYGSVNSRRSMGQISIIVWLVTKSRRHLTEISLEFIQYNAMYLLPGTNVMEMWISPGRDGPNDLRSFRWSWCHYYFHVYFNLS